MITYAERVCFRGRHLELRAHVETLVSRVSNAWGNELRCHELARAVARVVGEHGMIVVDGKCGPIEHSWLFLPAVEISAAVILDPYVPGRLPAVQLIDLVVGTAYRPGMPRSDIRTAVVDRLVAEMRDTASGTS